MRIFVINTGTELLLGDVRDAHLSFIAQQILQLGLRIEEQRTVPDGPAIQTALAEIFPRCELIFVTGGLGPTSDDITRDLAAELLGLRLIRDEDVLHSIRGRLRKRSIEITDSILRQADAPEGAQVLPNRFGTAPGLFLRADLNPRIPSPHLFLLPGPPRELQPMFAEFVMPIVRSLLERPQTVARKLYKIANMGESVVETKVGAKLLAIPGLEVGYCARPGEVDLRIMGEPDRIDAANAIIMESLGRSIFTTTDETLEEVIVHRLTQQHQTLSIAESCTGGLLAHRITNVPGASEVFSPAISPILMRRRRMCSRSSSDCWRSMARSARRLLPPWPRTPESVPAAASVLRLQELPGRAVEAMPNRSGTAFVGMAGADGRAEAHHFFSERPRNVQTDGGASRLRAAAQRISNHQMKTRSGGLQTAVG